MSGPGTPGVLLTVGATAVALFANPCTILDGAIYNTDTSDGFLLMWDKPVAEVVVGTTIPTYFVSVFGQSTSPLVRGSGYNFMRAVTIAAVSAITGSTTARVMNIARVIG